MKRIAFATALLLAAGVVATDWFPQPAQVWAEGDQHAYFNALVRRAEHWKSYSLRDGSPLAPPWITYNPAGDTDRNRQDAAKVVIPAFEPRTILAAATNSTDTVLTLQEAIRAVWDNNRAFKIDRETMTVVSWLSDTTISVRRGAYGTTPAPHAAGAAVKTNTNSVPAQVRVPLGTEDRHSYLFTWDGYWTSSYIGSGLTNHKAFQFSSGGRSGESIWFEPQANYGGGGSSSRAACYNAAQHIFAVGFRSYNRMDNPDPDWTKTDGNQLGPGVTNAMYPRVGELCAKPNTWVRFWVRIDQRALDYDYVDAWAADETTEAVQILRHLPISVRPTGGTPNSITKFWLEFNTSTDTYLRLDERDLVSYVRNFVALRDVSSVASLLIRPVPGAAPLPGPAPPRNVRIVS